MKEYKIGKNIVRIHGEVKKTERLEKAVKVFMSEVLKSKAAREVAR